MQNTSKKDVIKTFILAPQWTSFQRLQSRKKTSTESNFAQWDYYITLIVNCCHCTERPKPTVTIKPAQHVFRVETVTLRCDIYDEGVTSWSYRWYKEGLSTVFSELQEHTFSSVTESDAGKYSCNGSDTEGSRWSQTSDKVTLTVSGEFNYHFIHRRIMLLMSDLLIFLHIIQCF